MAQKCEVTEMGPLCFQCKPIGYVRSPYKDTQEIPKGLGAKHEAQGVLEILAEFEPGLTDIEGFSHLIVIWTFDRAEGFSLVGTPPSDDRPHGVFETRSPQRPNPIGLTLSSCSAGRARSCAFAASTCSKGLRFSTSSPISQTYRRNDYAAGGWRKPKRVPH